MFTFHFGWSSSCSSCRLLTVNYPLSQRMAFSSTVTFRMWADQSQSQTSHWALHTQLKITNDALSGCECCNFWPEPLNVKISQLLYVYSVLMCWVLWVCVSPSVCSICFSYRKAKSCYQIDYTVQKQTCTRYPGTGSVTVQSIIHPLS